MYKFLPFWISLDNPRISFHILGFEKISQYIKRYPGDIFLCPGISRLSLGCHGPWITPGLSDVQKSLVQSNAASNTKCSWNQRKFILNDAHEQTDQLVHQVQEDFLSLGAAAPLCRRRGLLREGRLLGAVPCSPLSLQGRGWL